MREIETRKTLNTETFNTAFSTVKRHIKQNYSHHLYTIKKSLMQES